MSNIYKKYETLFRSLDKDSINFLLNEDNQDRLIKYIDSLSPNNSIYAWLVYFIKEIRNIKGTPDAFTGSPSISDINKLVPDTVLTTIDKLTSTDKNNPLSANQGRVLRNMLEDLKGRVDSLSNLNLSKYIEYSGNYIYEVNNNLYGKTMNTGINAYSLKNIIGPENRYFGVSEENWIDITSGIPKPGTVYTVVLDIPGAQNIGVQLLCGDIPITSKVEFQSINGRNIIQLHTYNKIYYNDNYYLFIEVYNPPFTISNIMVLEGNIKRTNDLPEYVKNMQHITDDKYSFDLISIGQNKLDSTKMNNINNWVITDNYNFKYFKISYLNPNRKYLFMINNTNIPSDNDIEIVISQYPYKIEKFIVKGTNNTTTYAIVYPNMFGELFIGARNITSANFNKLMDILKDSYMAQSNFDLENCYEYQEVIKTIKLEDHLVADAFDETFHDRIFQDESGNVKINHKYTPLVIPNDAVIVKYVGSAGEYLENDRTELFRCEFYMDKDIDHLSLHNFTTEFTYVSPYLSSYIDIGEYCTIEKDKDKPVPLYVDDDYTELLVKDDKSLYITPIKTDEISETSLDNSDELSSKLESLEEFKVVINISKSKIDKVMRDNPTITDRTEALRKYIQDTNFKLYLELNTPTEELVPIAGFDIPIFEEGSTITTSSVTRPLFDFVIPNSLGTIIQSQVDQINNIYKVLYEKVLPFIIEV